MTSSLSTAALSSPLRCGVLGAARITPKALIEPGRATNSFEVVRVAARDSERASSYAAEHAIAHVSASYADLIAADDIDVVYNPLPMSLHAEWTIAALRAGKHVLCEKPFASNADEAQEMVDVAAETGSILGEAFHYWYHPLFQRVLAVVADGTIGTVERLDASFAISIPQPDLRWEWETSGGSTMDLGCYPIHWVRSIVGREPTVQSATAEVGPERIDAALTAELDFGEGVTASVHSAMNQEDNPKVELTIIGSDGHLKVTNPLAPQNGNRLTITRGDRVTDGEVEAGSTYAHMCRAFADHVVVGRPFPTKGEDSIANMRVIDAAYEAAGLAPRGK